MRSRDDLFDDAPAPARQTGGGAAKRPAAAGARRAKPSPDRWEGGLVDAARPVLEAALLLHRGGAAFDPTHAEFRRTVTNALDDFRIHARRAGVPDEEIQAAEYALVVFVDEMVSGSSWSGREQWDASHLEQERFSTALAGTEFFERIDRLRDSQRQALEVYYICLTLGFEGGYRGDAARRQELGVRIEAIRRRLGVPPPSWERPIFEDAYQPLRPTERAQRARGRLWLVIGGAAGGAVLVTYLVYWLILLQKAGQSAAVLSQG